MSAQEVDEMYPEAVRIVKETRRVSVSHLQRVMRIGYNRAATLIERMEADGILTEIKPGGVREIIGN